MASQLNPRHKEVLVALCNAFIPSIQGEGDRDSEAVVRFLDLSAEARGVPPLVEALFAKLPFDYQLEFKMLLTLMSKRMLGLTWNGPLKSFTELDPSQREAVLQAWSVSRLGNLRAGFSSLKKLICSIYYGHGDAGGDDKGGSEPDVVWRAIGYPGPRLDHPARSPSSSQSESLPALPVIKAAASETLSADVIVIGSGAGGSVVAAELAKAGRDVLLVDKGPYLSEAELNQQEVEMVDRLYDMHGALTNRERSMTVFAGSCIGGGTTINWSACLRTPEEILAEWAGEGNPHFTDAAYQGLFGEVEARLGVHSETLRHNPQNQHLWQGAEGVGIKPAWIPRNVGVEDEAAWTRSGYGALGDAYGDKRSTPRTWLQDAVACQGEGSGARILPNCEVTQLTIKGGEVTGAQTKSGLTLKAKQVVLALGALRTPVLLELSGLSHPQLGRHLHMHPTSAVSGVYPETVDPWLGPMMSAMAEQGRVRFETAPLHSGLMALAQIWRSGEAHKRAMLHARNTAGIICLVRDQCPGSVRASRSGIKIDYHLQGADLAEMQSGLATALRMHEVAGATSGQLMHQQAARVFASHDGVQDGVQDGEKGTAWGVDPDLAWRSNDLTVFSAHQMGSCRMGGNRTAHVVTPIGAVRGMRGVYVADGSLFPSASGVNPMISIQALALYVARAGLL